LNPQGVRERETFGAYFLYELIGKFVTCEGEGRKKGAYPQQNTKVSTKKGAYPQQKGGLSAAKYKK
jgi:hypothetical protein